MNSTNSLPPNGVPALNFTPMLGPNIFFLLVFLSLLILHVGLAIRFWTAFGYWVSMISGLLLEMLGYVAKVQLHANPAHKDAYILYIIGLTLGPTFLSSALYLAIGQIIRYDRHFHHQYHFGEKSLFGGLGPRSFASIFISGDFICLCFIGVGGSLAAIFAPDLIGVHLMIAGLATQVLFTTAFCVVLAILARQVLDRNRSLQWYLVFLGVAASCLFTRSCWRVAELSGGFNGRLASMEGAFIALDSVPMSIMSVLLTAVHPRFWFHGRS